MIERSCKICGSSNLIFFEHTVKCRICEALLYWPYPKNSDLVQGKSWPSRESVLAWYTKCSFYNHTNFTNMLLFTMGESFKGRKLDILDYGGGGGQFALVCKSHFPESTVYISDIHDDSLLEEWKPFNNQIPFELLANDKSKFDVIFLNDVFEHVSDPLFILKQLSEKLKPNGIIFIDTPKQFWIYPLTKLLSKSLYTKLLKGTVDTDHLQIWSRQSFELIVKKCDLTISKYKEVSEFTMPAEFYMDNMGVNNHLIRFVGSMFYRCAKLIAKNKIMCVLTTHKA